jgi:hypothetical protein
LIVCPLSLKGNRSLIAGTNKRLKPMGLISAALKTILNYYAQVPKSSKLSAGNFYDLRV